MVFVPQLSPQDSVERDGVTAAMGEWLQSW